MKISFLSKSIAADSFGEHDTYVVILPLKLMV